MGSKIRSWTVLICVVGLFAGLSPAGAATAPNDSFSHAQVLAGANVIEDGDLSGSSLETGEPATGFGGTFLGTVWFSWTAPAAGQITVTVNRNVGVGIYTGNSVNGLSTVAQGFAPATFSAVQGTTYRIAIARPTGSSVSAFTFHLAPGTAGAPNDNFAAARSLSGDFAGVVGTLRNSTLETGEPAAALGGIAGTVWYSWTAPANGVVTVATDILLGIGVYTGATPQGLAVVTQGTSPRSFTAVQGTTYRIAVARQTSSTTGFFTLTLELGALPANDNFTDAKVLDGIHLTEKGRTKGATREPGEPNHGNRNGHASVWYSWVAPAGGRTVLDACSSTAVVRAVGVYLGNSVDSLTEVGGAQCRILLDAVEGTTYRIAVESGSGSTGNFEFTLRPLSPPANDDFTDAITLTGDTALAWGTWVDGTIEYDEPTHGLGNGVSSAWYTWTAPQTGKYLFDSCGIYGPVGAIAAYTGNFVSSLDLVSRSGCELILDAVSGTVYRVALAQSENGIRPFKLRIKPFQPPANDNFANAQTISGTNVTVQGELAGGTRETGEPYPFPEQINSSVWYRWVSPVEGSVAISIGNQGAKIAAFKGSSIQSLATQAEHVDPLRFVVEAGTTYWIWVGREGTSTSGFTLTLDAFDEVPPQVMFDSGPSGWHASTTATFAFHGTPGDTAKIQCRLNQEPWVDCTSPLTLTGLPQGSLSLTIRAEDAAGNKSDPVGREIIVDTVPPLIQIHAGPSGTTASSTSAFAFGSNEFNVTFECKLDDGPFQPCVSPRSYSSLAPGAHTFTIRGTDPAGNLSTSPATRSWTHTPGSTTTTVSGTVPAGESVSTDPAGTGPTSTTPATAAITLPQGGEATVVQKPVDTEAPGGFTMIGQQFSIIAPDATVEEPLVLRFRIHSQALPGQYQLSHLTVVRNGELAASCSGPAGTATPDPCVSDREAHSNGDVTITVLSSRASEWNVALSDRAYDACRKARKGLVAARKQLKRAKARVAKAGKAVGKAKRAAGSAKKQSGKTKSSAAKRNVARTNKALRVAKRKLAKETQLQRKAKTSVSRSTGAVNRAC